MKTFSNVASMKLATDDLEVTVTSGVMGEEITVSIENKDATRRADLYISLDW